MSLPDRPADPSLFRLSTTLPARVRRERRHRGELPWLVVGITFTVLAAMLIWALLVLGLDTSGTVDQFAALIVITPIALVILRAYLYGQQRANGIRLSPTQFPTAYRMVVEASAAAGLRRVPDAYVVAGSGVLNAFASGHGHRRFVVIHSDLFELGGSPRDPDALRFVIGHEVGHLAAGHVSYWRMLALSLFQNVPVLSSALSRAQEYTADNYGHAFAPTGAPGAMAALAAGKYLNREILADEFADRAVTDRSLFIFAANALASHPVLTWRSHALRHRDRPGRLFFAPRQGVVAPLSLPPASTATAGWADPVAALAFLDVHAQPGRDVFGGVEVANRDAAIHPTPMLDAAATTPEPPAVQPGPTLG